MLSANNSSGKRSTPLGATRTFPRRRSVFESVEVRVGVIMHVGRTTRSWIQAEGVTPQERAPKRGDPSGRREHSVPEYAGLDEKAIARGHTYATIVCDL